MTAQAAYKSNKGTHNNLLSFLPSLCSLETKKMELKVLQESTDFVTERVSHK